MDGSINTDTRVKKQRKEFVSGVDYIHYDRKDEKSSPAKIFMIVLVSSLLILCLIQALTFTSPK